MTELKSCWLSKYLVETCSVGLNSSKWKESVTSKKNVTMKRMMQKMQILNNISDVEISSYNENISNVDFSTL